MIHEDSIVELERLAYQLIDALGHLQYQACHYFAPDGLVTALCETQRLAQLNTEYRQVLRIKRELDALVTTEPSLLSYIAVANGIENAPYVTDQNPRGTCSHCGCAERYRTAVEVLVSIANDAEFAFHVASSDYRGEGKRFRSSTEMINAWIDTPHDEVVSDDSLNIIDQESYRIFINWVLRLPHFDPHRLHTYIEQEIVRMRLISRGHPLPPPSTIADRFLSEAHERSARRPDVVPQPAGNFNSLDTLILHCQHLAIHFPSAELWMEKQCTHPWTIVEPRCVDSPHDGANKEFEELSHLIARILCHCGAKTIDQHKYSLVSTNEWFQQHNERIIVDRPADDAWGEILLDYAGYESNYDIIDLPTDEPEIRRLRGNPFLISQLVLQNERASISLPDTSPEVDSAGKFRVNSPPPKEFLGIVIDEENHKLKRHGYPFTIEFRGKVDWHIVIAAYRAGECGATRDEWRNGYPGDTEGKGPNAAKSRIREKLRPLGLTLADGEGAKIEELKG